MMARNRAMPNTAPISSTPKRARTAKVCNGNTSCSCPPRGGRTPVGQTDRPGGPQAGTAAPLGVGGPLQHRRGPPAGRPRRRAGPSGGGEAVVPRRPLPLSRSRLAEGRVSRPAGAVTAAAVVAPAIASGRPEDRPQPAAPADAPFRVPKSSSAARISIDGCSRRFPRIPPAYRRRTPGLPAGEAQVR